MSASDSSNLIDSPVAGRLGTNRAILHMVDQGTNEKFRPYGPPPSEWLDNVAQRWQPLVMELAPPHASANDDLTQFTIV